MLCVVLAGCGAAAPALADAVETEDTTQAETETAEGEEAQEPRAANANDVMRIEDALGAVHGKLDALEYGQQTALDALSGISDGQADMAEMLVAMQAESGTDSEVIAAIFEVRDILAIGCATLAALLGAVAFLPYWLQVAEGPHD